MARQHEELGDIKNIGSNTTGTRSSVTGAGSNTANTVSDTTGTGTAAPVAVLSVFRR